MKKKLKKKNYNKKRLLHSALVPLFNLNSEMISFLQHFWIAWSIILPHCCYCFTQSRNYENLFSQNYLSSLLSVKILPNQQKITKSYVFTKYFPNESKIFVFPHCVALKSTLLSTSIGHVSFTHPFYSRRQNPHTIHLYFINSLLSYSVDNTNFPTPIIMPFCLKICQCCQLYLKIVNI